jgi:hypothetical protein
MSIDGIGIRVGPGPTVARTVPERAPPKVAERTQDLRSVLSADELAYFAELERLGPLTYGPKAAQRTDGAPPILGQRIDVRA